MIRLRHCALIPLTSIARGGSSHRTWKQSQGATTVRIMAQRERDAANTSDSSDRDHPLQAVCLWLSHRGQAALKGFPTKGQSAPHFSASRQFLVGEYHLVIPIPPQCRESTRLFFPPPRLSPRAGCSHLRFSLSRRATLPAHTHIPSRKPKTPIQMRRATLLC
jgi:hypothetical protein